MITEKTDSTDMTKKGHIKFRSIIKLIGLNIIIMTSSIWIKVAVGALTGLATVAALGGFSKKSEEKINEYQSSEEIPDEILDGPLSEVSEPNDRRQKSRDFRDMTERNVRGFQDTLSKLSSIIGSLSIAVTNIMRVFYEDPYERVTPTTIIY